MNIIERRLQMKDNMSSIGTFVNITDVGKVLMEFIGSEEFDNIVKNLDNNPKNIFMGAIGVAGCLIMSKCPKYSGYEKKIED